MDKVEEQFILLHTTLQARYLQLMNGLALVAEMQAANLQAIVSAVLYLSLYSLPLSATPSLILPRPLLYLPFPLPCT